MTLGSKVLQFLDRISRWQCGTVISTELFCTQNERISHRVALVGSALETSARLGPFYQQFRKQGALVSFLPTCMSMSSPTSLALKENYWVFHGKTHKRKEGLFYAPLEEMAVLITEGLDWFQSYSRTAAPFTQQKQQQQKNQNSTFSCDNLVFFSKLHIKTHTQWKHSLSLGHQSRGNLQTRLSQMRPFLCILRLALWGSLPQNHEEEGEGPSYHFH